MMKTWMRCATAALAVVGWISCGGPVGAQEMPEGGMDRPGPGGPGMGMHEGRMRGGPGEEAGFQDWVRDPEAAAALNLTEEQKDKIKTITTQFRKEMIDWNAKLQHATLAQVDLMEQEEPALDAVLKGIDETGRIRNEIAKLRVKQLFAVRAILTPEQREKARELFRDRMAERRKAGDGAGPMGGRGAKGDRGARMRKAPEAPAKSE